MNDHICYTCVEEATRWMRKFLYRDPIQDAIERDVHPDVFGRLLWKSQRRCARCGEILSGDSAEVADGVIHAECMKPDEEIA